MRGRAYGMMNAEGGEVDLENTPDRLYSLHGSPESRVRQGRRGPKCGNGGETSHEPDKAWPREVELIESGFLNS